MFWVDQTLVFDLHQLLHDRKHVVVARIDETFNIFVIGHGDRRIAIVNVVDAISRTEVTTDFDRIVTSLPCPLRSRR